MDIVKTLQYNKHPKSVHDYSLVDAVGWKVSDDGTTLVLDDSIIPIKNLSRYNILGVIPCPYEFILILKSKINSPSGVFFYRYGKDIVGTEVDELIDDIILPVEDGEYNGTYSYNINNELIIALGNSNPTAPLRVINFGLAGSDVYTGDRGKSASLLGIIPEIKLPSLTNIAIVKGSSYKGIYELFIRFKYNEYDYSNWISIGPDIILDEIQLQKVFEYKQCRYTQSVGPEGGFDFNNVIKTTNGDTGATIVMSPIQYDASDYFSTNQEVIGKTIKLTFNFDNRISDIFQIGCIIRTNISNKCFRTEDINYGNNSISLNLSSMVEYNINDITIENMNLFGVKNITTFKNRLYISNYYENIIKNEDCIESAKNVEIKLRTETIVNAGNDTKMNVSIVPDISGSTTDNAINNVGLGNNFTTISRYRVITVKHYLGLDNEPESDLNACTFTYNSEVYNLNTVNLLPIDVSTSYGENPRIRQIGYGKLGISNTFSDAVEITSDIKIIYKNKTYIIPANQFMTYGEEYLDTHLSFDDRCINNTLIPGEVYNFYIHFYDKYGKITDGFKIEPKFYSINGINLYIPLSYYCAYNNRYKNYIFAVSKDLTMSHFISNLKNKNNIRLYISIVNNEFIDEVTGDEKTSVINSLYNNLHITDETILNLKVNQVLYTGSPISNNYGIFVNNAGDKFFRIPNYNFSPISSLSKFFINVNNVVLPANAKGYIISYEKFEPIKHYRGFLTKFDFQHTNFVNWVDRPYLDGNNNDIKVPNSDKSSTCYFYCDDIDIKSKINLKCNLMTVKQIRTFKNDIKNVFYLSYSKDHKNVFNYNFPIYYTDFTILSFHSLEKGINLVIANDSTKGRLGKGSAFEINNINGLFDKENADDEDKLYIADLLYINPNIYDSKNKTLIKLSEHLTSNNSNINIGNYNGHYTYQGVLIYNQSGVYLDETVNKFKRFLPMAERTTDNVIYSFDSLYYSDIIRIKELADNYSIFELRDRCICGYIQYLNCDTYMHESKEFNNPPKNYVFHYYPGDSYDKKPDDSEDYQYDSFSTVIPQDTIDLFKNIFDDVPIRYKTLINYDTENKYNNIIFNKTIRRSLVFTDEGLNNNWKIFKPEAYKMLDSNKGIITNLASIGNVFLVHTNQTLFQVSNDNTLQANNTELAFATVDIFDIDFQEVFTSALGFAGLRKSSDAILNEFGYIFYDAYNKAIYQYDSRQIKNLDIDISYWIKHKCDGVQFGFDKLNNRLFIQIIKAPRDDDGSLNPNNVYFNDCLSYDLRTQSFISRHPIKFNKAFNTKDNLYFVDSLSIISKIERTDNYGIIPLSLLNRDNIKYLDYNITPQINSMDTCSVDPKINIIVNTEYETIKYIEYITYKIRKIIKGYIENFDPSDGNKDSVKIYPGDKLRIYNDLIDTGEIDISQSEDNFNNIGVKPIFKPYYDLGNWNINTLKNNLIGYNVKKDDELSRLYGNYFVIEFKFKNTDLNQIEFESISAILTSKRI